MLEDELFDAINNDKPFWDQFDAGSDFLANEIGHDIHRNVCKQYDLSMWHKLYYNHFGNKYSTTIVIGYIPEINNTELLKNCENELVLHGFTTITFNSDYDFRDETITYVTNKLRNIRYPSTIDDYDIVVQVYSNNTARAVICKKGDK